MSKESPLSLFYTRFVPDHLSQVNDEAVAVVEASPGKIHLCGFDHPATFNVQHALHIDVVGDHVVEAGGNAAFLQHR